MIAGDLATILELSQNLLAQTTHLNVTSSYITTSKYPVFLAFIDAMQSP